MNWQEEPIYAQIHIDRIERELIKKLPTIHGFTLREYFEDLRKLAKESIEEEQKENNKLKEIL